MAEIKEQRTHPREKTQGILNFIVLSLDASTLKRQEVAGNVVDASPLGIGIETEFPLQPGQILEWDDIGEKDKLKIGLVKWVRKEDDRFRAGLKFL